MSDDNDQFEVAACPLVLMIFRLYMIYLAAALIASRFEESGKDPATMSKASTHMISQPSFLGVTFKY